LATLDYTHTTLFTKAETDSKNGNELLIYEKLNLWYSKSDNFFTLFTQMAQKIVGEAKYLSTSTKNRSYLVNMERF